MIKNDGVLLVVRCDWSKEEWHLTCNNGEWIGEVGQCYNMTVEATPG